MSPGDAFIRRQDDELKALERHYREKAVALVDAWKREAPHQEQVDSLLELHRAGTEYFRRLDAEVLNSDSLSGAEYQRWKAEWIVTTAKNLNELPRYHRILRENRHHLALPDTMFEPPGGAYYNIQRFFAATSREQVPEVRLILAEAKIPTAGLDKPYIPKPHFDMGIFRPLVSVLIVLLLLAAFVVASNSVNPIVLGGILSVIVVLLVFMTVTELLREGKLKEKSFFEITKLVLARRFQFAFGKKEPEDKTQSKKKKS